MVNPRIVFALLSFVWISSLTACFHQPSKPSIPLRSVAVKPILQANGNIRTVFLGRVISNDATQRTSSYRVQVEIPGDAHPQVSRGQRVHVILPILHNKVTDAIVEGFKDHHMELLLPGQIQVLSGYTVRVQVDLDPKNLYRIPFNAVYSPRWDKKQVFVLNQNRVEMRPLQIVQRASVNEVWVTGSFKSGEQVVIQGLDSLLSGDEVRVVNN